MSGWWGAIARKGNQISCYPRSKSLTWDARSEALPPGKWSRKRNAPDRLAAKLRELGIDPEQV